MIDHGQRQGDDDGWASRQSSDTEREQSRQEIDKHTRLGFVQLLQWLCVAPSPLETKVRETCGWSREMCLLVVFMASEWKY